MLLPCGNCCCNDCTDGTPSRLVVTTSYPAGGGEVVAENSPSWEAVTTDCQPPPGNIGIFVAITDRGSGYTSAPSTSLSAGDAVLEAYIRAPVKKVEVTNGGSGYTAAPAVTFSNGTPIRAAAAVAVVKGGVTAISVSSGGSGYTSPPTVSVSGGDEFEATAVMSGYVYQIAVTDGGSQYVSPPTVTISGGGGSGATAAATLMAGKVQAITVLSQGTNYTTAPTVTISGGGGSGATATATLRYSVASVSIVSQGVNFPLSPAVTFTGGGGSGATASATVTGSVVSVKVTDGGLYSNGRRSDGSEPYPWPTITFSGGGGSGAAASPEFAGVGLHNIVVWVQDDYDTPPTISITGGGGTGAAAEARLEWDSTTEHYIDIRQTCLGALPYQFCTSTDSENYPEAPCLGCGGQALGTDNEPPDDARYGERFDWYIATRTSLLFARESPGGRYPDSAAIGWEPYRDADFLFAAEGLYVYHRTRWTVVGAHTQIDDRLWLKRAYSRVEPAGNYEVPFQPASAVNAVLTPSFQQYEDLSGQAFWWLESISISAAGENLLATMPGVVSLVPAAGNNFASQFSVPVTLTYTFSPPVANELALPTFSVLPTFSFTFTQSGPAGYYVLSAVAVTSGGTTEVADGTYSMGIQSYSVGYAESSPIVAIEISGGEVQSASIISGGSILGGAAVSGVTLVEAGEPGYDADTRVNAGRSDKIVTVTFSEPTVTASAIGGDAEFSVTLTEGVDANGNPFWYVSDIAIVDGGSGYDGPVAIDFTATPPDGIESIPAVAVANIPPRQEPTLSVEGLGEFTISYTQNGDVWEVASITVDDGGEGYENQQNLTLILGQDDVEISAATAQVTTVLAEPTITATVDGGSGADLTVSLQAVDGGWEVASVSVEDGGVGYTDGASLTFSGGDQGDGGASAVISTDESGTILSVTVVFGGLYYDDTGVAESVEVLFGGTYYKQPTYLDDVTLVSGGRYYNKTITETEQPLPDLGCLGAVSEEAGWEQLRYKPEPGASEENVGGSFESQTQVGCWFLNSPSYTITLTRTRRCPFPTFSFEFQQ